MLRTVMVTGCRGELCSIANPVLQNGNVINSAGRMLPLAHRGVCVQIGNQRLQVLQIPSRIVHTRVRSHFAQLALPPLRGMIQ